MNERDIGRMFAVDSLIYNNERAEKVMFGVIHYEQTTSHRRQDRDIVFQNTRYLLSISFEKCSQKD